MERDDSLNGPSGTLRRRCGRLSYVHRGAACELLILTPGDLSSSRFNSRRALLVACPLSDAVPIYLAFSITLDISQPDSLTFMSSWPGISTWWVHFGRTYFNGVSNRIRHCFSGPPKQGTAKKGGCRQR